MVLSHARVIIPLLRKLDDIEPMDKGVKLEFISGQAVFPNGTRPVTIAIEDGLIKYVEDAGHDEQDAGLIFPGFVDIHVHAREYPRPADNNPSALAQWEAVCRKETFSSAGKAAINGGVTLFAAMPNDPSPPDGPQSYARKLELSSSSPCPVILFAAVTERSDPWTDIPYKVYLDPRPSPISFCAWRDLKNTVARYGGCRVFFHAEDPEFIEKLGTGGPRWKIRPPQAEIRAVDQILELTARHGFYSHICHVSTQRTVELIADYNRNSSLPVTCEATPHHLFFNISEEGVFGGGRKLDLPPELLDSNPPLRTEPDRLFMLDALKYGLVDVLASDHAPHTMEDKKNGAPGIPHLDTLGPFVGWLIKECSFSPSRICEILSATPGRIMSRDVDQPRGSIEKGFSASFTVLDLSRSSVVEDAEIRGRGHLQTRCSWSPFSGISLPAIVTSTVVNGREYTF